MMGSGKSTVGRLLAERAQRRFVDTDQLVVHRLGRPIHQLFSIYGQDAFRDHESSVLKSLKCDDFVLATGGGIVLRDTNWIELKRLGIVAFLDLPLDVLAQRLERSAKRRPLLEVENWEGRLAEIYAERRPLYQKADLTLELESEDLEEAATKLYERLIAWS